MARRFISLLVLALVGLAAGPLAAIEPAQEFLNGLRERGYFDVALDYLNSAANNPNIPVQFRETLPYERGVTLVKSARFQRDSALREQQLDEGQQALQQFVTGQPNHLLSISARNELGNVIIERANSRVERSKKVPPAEKQVLLKEAHGLYSQAVTTFTKLVDELKVKLTQYPAALDPVKDEQRIKERDRFRQDYMQSQLLAALVREEMIETLEKNSKEWTETLTQATDSYKAVYENYRTRLAGLYARMNQGRCLYKLGKAKEASAIYSELLSNPDSPDEFRALKIKVMVLAVDSWAAQGLSVETIDKAGKVIDAVRPSEDKTDDIMGIRLAVARACKSYSAELAKKNARDPQIKSLMSSGQKLVAYVQKFPGEYQEAARRLMPEFSGNEAVATGRKEPKNFLEAHTAAKEAIDTMQAANLLQRTLPGRIDTTKETEEKAKLEQQLREAQSQASAAQADALHYCRLALQFADEDVVLDDLNLIRYVLSYLLFTDGKYNEAAVVGEFLAYRYPQSQGARPCAQFAMKAYLKLYAENETDDTQYESDKIVSIADYIVKTWPDQPEAADALNTLIPFMIRERKLQLAQDYLARIPVDSPQRGTAELKTGQAMWASYLESSQQIRDWENGVAPMPEGTDLAARKAELDVLKSKAKQTLVDGVGRMQASGETSSVMATAVLSLVQIYVDTNEAQKAVTLMEDEKIGVLTLVKNNDPSVAKEGFSEETYKTALRAYISSLASGGDAAASVTKAEEIMEGLKQQMGKTPEGQARLIAIYVSLARDLQRQMEIADPDVKKSLGQGFETFLKQVAADATELNILNWVAETYRGMGESFGGHVRNVPQDSRETAKKYLDQAASTYQRILNIGKTNASFLTPGMTTHLRLQLAKTKRIAGDYVGAMDMFEAILKAKPAMLPVQIEAARTYQDWGSFKDAQDNYMKAIVGGRPDKNNRNKNVIWGWGEIARMTAPSGPGSNQFKDQFHEARYNLALCRYNYAISQKDSAGKKKQFQDAKRDIAVIAGFYPDMGGEKWKPQYNILLKNIQKVLGEEQLGLQALQTEPAPATPAGGAPSKTGPAKTVPTSAPAATTPAKGLPVPAKGKAAPAKAKAAQKSN